MCVKKEYFYRFQRRNTRKTTKVGTMRGMNWKCPMHIYILTDELVIFLENLVEHFISFPRSSKLQFRVESYDENTKKLMCLSDQLNGCKHRLNRHI